MDIEHSPSLPSPTPMQTSDLDPALEARLARLAASRVSREQHKAPVRTTPPAATQRKRHAAKGSRTAAALMSLAATAGLTAYFQHADSAAASNSSNALTGAAVASGTVASTATVASTTVASSTASASTSSTLADGTYSGATANNRYGPVQVQITVVNGQITASAAVQLPTDRKSVSINNRATPKLASEVLTAQSAKIDTVSGATYTSQSYKASLQSAIDLAHTTASQTPAKA